MAYLIPIVIVVFGIGTKFLVEVSSELTHSVLFDADKGIEVAGTRITAEGIVDMRPEISLGSDARSDPDQFGRVR